MSQKNLLEKIPIFFFILVTGLTAIFFLEIFFPQEIFSWLALTLATILTAFFFLDPEKGFLALLILRPTIDKFSDTISIRLNENLSFNASAGFGVLTSFLLSILIIKNKKFLLTLPLKKWWGGFVLICVFSLFFSASIPASFYEIIRIVSIILVFVAAFIFVKKEKKNYLRIAWAIVISCWVPFVFATYQLITKSGLGGTDGIESRLFGTFSHPNPFASFVFIALAILLFLFFFSKEKSFKPIIFLIFWALFLLVGTYSRGAWLAFLIFLLVIAFFKSFKSILAIVFISIILFFSFQSIQDRVQDIYNPPADSSVRWRFAQWERMYEIFKKRPLIGQGIGTETIVHDLEYGPYSGNPYTHNDFLRVATETGVFGFIIYFLLIFSTLNLLYKNFKEESSGIEKDFQLIVLVLFLAMATFSLTNNTLRETVTQWLLWSLVGTSLALASYPLKKIQKD